ncbi:MAG: hypothetical protein BGO69_10475 [Bacteroidetes bacterium 46-16]|nr:MAG: hypothetical protein BGO69_10475 [Bacteroidetes bacterium 46-16]
MSNYYNIFYTDDDADDQDIFREAVKEINEEIYIFTQNNGDELMAMLRNPPPSPHMVFLDLNMPVKNGFEVLRDIRRSERFRDMPIVIFSTSSERESIARTRELGATLYITKPESYQDLKKVLHDVLTIDWEAFKRDGKDFVYRMT